MVGKPTEKKSSSFHVGPCSYTPIYPSKITNPSFSFGYKENFSFIGKSNEEEENLKKEKYFAKLEKAKKNKKREKSGKKEQNEQNENGEKNEKIDNNDERKEKKEKSENIEKKIIETNEIKHIPKNLKNKKIPKKKKNTMIGRSLSPSGSRNEGPGPGFYQPNYANMINGPAIK